jgi:RHS repeat-associated protein
MPGIQSVAGVPFVDSSTAPMRFRTFLPHVIYPTASSRMTLAKILSDTGDSAFNYKLGVAMKDMEYVTRTPQESVTGRWETYVTGLISGVSLGAKLVMIDASDPRQPRAVKSVAQGERYYQRLRLFPDFQLDLREPTNRTWAPIDTWMNRDYVYARDMPSIHRCFEPGDPFRTTWEMRNGTEGRVFDVKKGCGHLAASSAFNSRFSQAFFYDLFKPASAAVIGQRVLSDSRGSHVSAPASQGYVRGFDLLPGIDITHEDSGTDVNTNATGIYTAVAGVGLELADVGRNSADIDDNERINRGGQLRESLGRYSFPYYRDIVILNDKVIALALDDKDGTGTQLLEMFQPGLGEPIARVSMPVGARQMTLAKALPLFEASSSKFVTHDLLFATGGNSTLTVFEANSTTPSIRGVNMIALPGATSAARDGSYVKSMGQVQIDVDASLAFVAAEWMESGNRLGGFFAFDLERMLQGPADQDGNGWDDRVVARIPVVGAGQLIADGIVGGFRFDRARRLIYTSVEMDTKDTNETGFAIVKATNRPDADVTLTTAVVPVGTVDRQYQSADGSSVVLFVNPLAAAGRPITLGLGVTIFRAGLTLNYTITEKSLSGRDADKLLDMAQMSGVLNANDPNIRLIMKSTDTASAGSIVYIDIRDEQGNFVKRIVVNLVNQATALKVLTPRIGVSTLVDRQEMEVDRVGRTIRFEIGFDAKVTLRIDGQVALPRLPGQPSTTRFEDIPLAAGVQEIPISPDMVPAPGTHPFEITAVFTIEGAETIEKMGGEILHGVTLTPAMSVGHTFIKNVDLANGNLVLQREDFKVPTVGPSLTFVRSYSAAGNSGEGPMGAGWSHNYLSKAKRSENGKIRISGGEGGGVTFSRPQPGADFRGVAGRLYQPTTGYHSQLFERTDGSLDFFTKEKTKYHYSLTEVDAYRLDFIEDTHGNRLTLTYDSFERNLLTKVTDASGRSLSFTYQTLGQPPEKHITRVDGPIGLVLEYTYDEAGNLKSATRGSRIERYHYTVNDVRDRHNLVRVEGPNHETLGPTYDVTTYQYFASTETVPGETTSYDFGDPKVILIGSKEDMVKTVTEGAGSSDAAQTRFAYDFRQFDTQWITTTTDGRNIDTVWTIHPRGAVLSKQTDNITETTRWAFQEGINDVLVTEKKDANGRVTRFDYDGRGNLEKETVQLTSLPATYHPVQKANGTVLSTLETTYTYDPTFNRLLSNTDAEGNTVTHTLDPNTGAVLTTTRDPKDGTGLSVETLTYKTANGLKGLLATRRDPRGNVTTFTTYDAFGNPTEIEDAEGNTTTNVYDERGRLRESQDTVGRRSTTTYDDFDNPSGSTRFAGRQPTETTMASANVVRVSSHLPSGLIQSETDGLGSEKTYTYDALGRVITEANTVQDADGQAVTYTRSFKYDGNGNRREETDVRGFVHVFQYDNLNRLEVETIDGVKVRGYTYDAAGNRLSETNVYNSLTTFEYDRAYRVVRTVLPVTPYVTTQTYDAVGSVLKKTDANGQPTVMTYDGLYRLKSVTNAVGTKISYTYDLAGNRTLEHNETNGLRVETSDYDGLNRPGRVTQVLADPLAGGTTRYTTVITYDDANHTRTVQDARGTLTREQLNGLDMVIERRVDTADLNLRTVQRFDANGNLVSVLDPNLHTSQTLVDGLGRKVTTTDGAGHRSRAYFDGAGNITKTIDRRGVTRHFTYDFLNRKKSETLEQPITNASNLLWEEVAYDDVQRTISTTDALRHTTVSALDPMGREVRRTNALDQTTRWTWDGVNRRTETNRRNHTRSFDYDGINRLTKVTDPAPFATQTETTVYDDANTRESTTDRRSIVKVVQKDALDRIRRITRAGIVLETNTYDALGNRITSADGEGHTTQLSYDGAGRLKSQTVGFGTAEAARTEFDYDAAGNQTILRDALAVARNRPFTVRNTYDNVNRLRTTEDGEGNVTRFDYDPEGNRTKVTTPLLTSTDYTFDELGKLLTVTQPGGVLTQYRYDAKRNPRFQIDAEGHSVEMTYDEIDRLKMRIQDPGGLNLVTSFGYDAADNLESVADPNGQVVTWIYDELNRKSGGSWTFAAGSTVRPWRYLQSLTNVFDANNNLREVRETIREGAETKVLVSSRTYDDLDRLTAETTPLADGTRRAVAYDYFNNGLRRHVTEPSGQSTSYAYNARNQLATATSDAGITQYDYFGNGLKRSVNYPNGVVETSNYDNASRLVSLTNAIASTLISSFTYRYDANGNRKWQFEFNGGVGEETSYDYDALDRLETVTYPADAKYSSGRTVVYGYDRVGNRRSEITQTPNGSAVLESKAGTFDAVNRLTLLTDNLNSSQTTEFDYDANGNQTRKTKGGISTLFRYDARDRMTEVFVGTNTVSRFDYDFEGRRRQKIADKGLEQFVYDQTSTLSEFDGSNQVVARYDYGSDRLISLQHAQEGRRFYQFDTLGSVTNLTDDAGSPVANYHLDAWGEYRFEDELAASQNRFGFTGHAYDRETSLVFAKGRYYDPEVGRFTNQDSHLGVAQSPPTLHRYFYALGNPLRYVDPDGHYPMPVAVIPYTPEMQKVNQEQARMLELRARQIAESPEGKLAYGFFDEFGTSVVEGVKGAGLLFYHAIGNTMYDITGAEAYKDSKIYKKQASKEFHEKWGFVFDYSAPGDVLSRFIVTAAMHFDKNMTKYARAFNQAYDKEDYEGMGRALAGSTNEVLALEDVLNNAKGVMRSGGGPSGPPTLAPATVVEGGASNFDARTMAGPPTPSSNGMPPLMMMSKNSDAPSSRTSESASSSGGPTPSGDPNSPRPLTWWLEYHPELLSEARWLYRHAREWWGIHPEKDLVFRMPEEWVKAFRTFGSEKGGHHPWGLALGGHPGQKLTLTFEHGRWKNPAHSYITAFQKKVINAIDDRIAELEKMNMELETKK